MRGRENKTPLTVTTSAIEIVKGYLAAVEKRYHKMASKFLGDNFWMEFRGSVRMTKLEQLVLWSKPRDKSVKNYFDFLEAYRVYDTLITCHGMLDMIFTIRDDFQGIRFIDVFTISGHKFTGQLVWNDLDTVKSM